MKKWIASPTSPQRVVSRSRMVLLAASGLGTHRIARQLGTTPSTVRLWWRRFLAGGADGLLRDAPGRGRKKGVDPRLSRDVVAAMRMLHDQQHRCSARAVARAASVSPTTVLRVWRALGIGAGTNAEARAWLLNASAERTNPPSST